MRVIVHRAFDGISLDQLRLAPVPDEPHQAAAILAAQLRIGHTPHQQHKDPGRLGEQAYIALESAQRVTAQIKRAG